MEAIRASYEILTPLNGIEILKHIERCGRVCYKSEDRITDESCFNFVKGIIKSGHESVIEHFSFTVKFIVDRGVSHEIVRHRIASYSQESTRYCVAGDTYLTFKNPSVKMSVSELFDKIQNSKNGSWKRYNIRQLDENSGELVYSHIKNVFKTGLKDCFKVVTSLGYTLECTKDHRIYTGNGYVPLNDLQVGDNIYVNGKTIQADALYKDYDWLYHQSITLNKTFVEIAKEFGFNISVVKKWARKLGLPKKGTGYFNVGRVPWNKGVSEFDDVRVKKQANALRMYHYDTSKKGQRIVKENTKKYQKYQKGNCEVCGNGEGLAVHHKDENRDNNYPDNLFTVCASCHMRIHSKNVEIAFLDKIISIEPSGTKEVYDIEMPKHHNFVANGVIVHNCNYSKDDDIVFIYPYWLDEATDNEWRWACGTAERAYLDMLKKGATPQEARGVLPSSLKTEVIMTANLREWRHFLKLRTPISAHPQIREVAIPLLLELQDLIPIVFDDINYY